jgi:DNA-binding NtrC family response regulator
MSSILIVDDEAAVRELLARWLAAEGYEIRKADTAECALASMTAACADVVLCDVEMPGQGGLWLAAQLRERYPMSAMVLATALDSVPPATSLQAGIVEYLVKPFDRANVISAVAHGVRWHIDAVERSLKPAPARESMSTWLDSSLEPE